MVSTSITWKPCLTTYLYLYIYALFIYRVVQSTTIDVDLPRIHTALPFPKSQNSILVLTQTLYCNNRSHRKLIYTQYMYKDIHPLSHPHTVLLTYGRCDENGSDDGGSSLSVHSKRLDMAIAAVWRRDARNGPYRIYIYTSLL